MNRISWLCITALALSTLFTTGCESSEPDTPETNQTPDDSVTPEPDTETPPDNAAASVGPYDGTYTVTFITSGVQAALGTLVVENSRFSGDLVSIFSEVFWIEGYLDNDGNFVFEPVEGNQGSIVVAEGQIQNGLVSGSYEVNDGERGGIFCGSLGSTPFDLDPVTEFDGTYEVALNFSGAEVANTVFNVENGRFTTSITTIESSTFEMGGFVTSDGTIVVSMLEGDATIDELLAEGSIDHGNARGRQLGDTRKVLWNKRSRTPEKEFLFFDIFD